MESLKQLGDNIIVILIVVFAAIVHATVQLKIARDKKDDSFNIVDFLILIPISAFAGLIFGLMASLFFDAEIAIWLSSGIGAFLGIAGLNKLSAAFLEFLISKSKK